MPFRSSLLFLELYHAIVLLYEFVFPLLILGLLGGLFLLVLLVFVNDLPRLLPFPFPLHDFLLLFLLDLVPQLLHELLLVLPLILEIQALLVLGLGQLLVAHQFLFKDFLLDKCVFLLFFLLLLAGVVKQDLVELLLLLDLLPDPVVPLPQLAVERFLDEAAFVQEVLFLPLLVLLELLSLIFDDLMPLVTLEVAGLGLELEVVGVVSDLHPQVCKAFGDFSAFPMLMEERHAAAQTRTASNVLQRLDSC